MLKSFSKKYYYAKYSKNKVAVMMAEVKLDTMRAGFEGCENWPKLHDVAGEINSGCFGAQ